MEGFIQGLLISMLALCVPLLIAAIGEIFVERSGQFNMGIEGMMAFSALSAFAAALATGHPMIGIAVGTVTGTAAGYVMFVLIERLRLSGILVAVVFNLLAQGVTGFLATFFINGGSVPMQSAKLKAVSIPVLSALPWVGDILFSQNMMVYVAVLMVPAASWLLFHTRFGLALRAVGERELAAQTMGIRTSRMKRNCFLIGGAAAGLAGAYMSLTLGMFVDGMTENKGFIAMALCVFSGRNPWGSFWGALLFSLADSLQIRLQVFNLKIPYEFFLMLPYVMTIGVLVMAAGRKKEGGRLI